MKQARQSETSFQLRPFAFAFSLLGALALSVPAAAALSPEEFIKAERASYGNAIVLDERDIEALNQADPESEDLREMRAKLLEHQGTYRALAIEEAKLTLTPNEGEKEEHFRNRVCTALNAVRNRVNQAYLQIAEDLQKSLDGPDIHESFDDQARGMARAKLRLLFLDMSAIAERAAAVGPDHLCLISQNWREPRYPRTDLRMPELTPGTEISATVQQIIFLTGILASRDPNNVIYNPKVRSETTSFVLQAQQDIAFEEFKRLAVSGVIVDPRTNRPFLKKRRIDVALLIEHSLVDYLTFVSERPLWIELFWADDGRAQLAKEIEESIERSPIYRAVAYLDSGLEPEAKEFFMATRLAILADQELMIGKFSKEYLGEDYWTRGVGQRVRSHDWPGTGDSGFTAVRARLQKVLDDGQIVADVFKRAADQEDPSKLPEADYELLKSFGYIIEFPDESGQTKTTYHIPGSRQGLGQYMQRTNDALMLPGASVLDFLSPKNAGITIISVVVPELGASWLVHAGTRAGMAARGLIALRIMADVGIGTAMDAGIEVIETEGQINYENLILESVVLGNILNVSGYATPAVLEVVLNQSSKAIAKTQLYKAIGRGMRRDEGMGRLLYQAITEGTGLATETAITATFQQYVQGLDIDATALQTILLNNALARSVAKSNTSAEAWLAGGNAPTWLNRLIRLNPALRPEILAAINKRLTAQEAVRDRLAEIIRDEGDVPELLFNKLLDGTFSWSEIKQINADDPELMGGHLAKVAKYRELFFTLLIHKARNASIDEINLHFAALEAAAVKKAGSKEAAKDVLAALSKRKQSELDLVNAYVTTPGSKDPTSDIDRSSESAYLRKNLRMMYQVHAQRLTGTEPPTSARAVDVNEYINVFLFITENAGLVPGLKRQKMVDDLVRINGRPTNMDHPVAMESISLSGAMVHMRPWQVRRFKKNLTEALRIKIDSGDAPPEAMAALRKQLDYASASLKYSEGVLDVYKREAAERLERLGREDIDDFDVLIEAKDKLYDERMREIRDMQVELAQLEREHIERENSEDALALRAQIERKLAVAMRDGIETYSFPIGLDIIVNRVQSATKPVLNENGDPVIGEDGEPKTEAMTAADRLNDERFTIFDELNMYDRRDVNGIVNDQVMFLMHHVNAFNAGHESAYLTARALGKYIERAFLAMKIGGLDISRVREAPETDSTRRLLEIAQGLAARKKDPAEIVKYLTEISRQSPGTRQQGLAEIFFLMEQVLSGMEGLTGVLPGGSRFSAPDHKRFIRATRRVAVHKDNKRLMEIIEITGGEGTAQFLQAEIEFVDSQVRALEKELEGMRELGGEYRLVDMDGVRKLMRQETGLERNLMAIPWRDRRSQTYDQEHIKLNRVRIKLGELRRRRDSSNIDEVIYADPNSREFRRLKDRLEWLGERKKWLLTKLEEAKELAEKQAVFDDLDLSGNWVCGVEGEEAWTGVLRHQEDVVHLELTSKELSGDGPHVIFDAWHIWGTLRGFWQDPASVTEPVVNTIPVTQTRMVFRAEVSPHGNDFKFKYAPTHPRTPFDWNGKICRRLIEPETGSVGELFTISMGPVDADRSSWVVEGKGFLDVVVSDPEYTDEFADYTLYFRNRPLGIVNKFIPLPAGTYQIGVVTGGRNKFSPVQINDSGLTTVTIDVGSLRLSEKGVDGTEIVTSFSIFLEGEKQVRVYRSYSFEHQLIEHEPIYPRREGLNLLWMPPGTYSIQFGADTGASIWRRGVRVSKNQTLDVSAIWSKITLKYPNDIMDMGIGMRRDIGPEVLDEWDVSPAHSEISGNTAVLWVAPGDWETTAFSMTTGPVHHKFSIGEGEEKTEQVE